MAVICIVFISVCCIMSWDLTVNQKYQCHMKRWEIRNQNYKGSRSRDKWHLQPSNTLSWLSIKAITTSSKFNYKNALYHHLSQELVQMEVKYNTQHCYYQVSTFTIQTLKLIFHCNTIWVQIIEAFKMNCFVLHCTSWQ